MAKLNNNGMNQYFTFKEKTKKEKRKVTFILNIDKLFDILSSKCPVLTCVAINCQGFEIGASIICSCSSEKHSSEEIGIH